MAEIDATTEDFELGFYSFHTPEPYYAEWNQHQVSLYSNDEGYTFAQKALTEGSISLVGYDPDDCKSDSSRDTHGEWEFSGRYNSERGNSLHGHFAVENSSKHNNISFRGQLEADINSKGELEAKVSTSGKF